MLLKPRYPQLQRGDPPARGLVAAWPFFEGAGTVIRDVSGNNNHLTTTFGSGAFGYEAGAYGSQFRFTSSRAVPATTISIPANDSGGKWSIAFVFTPRSQSGAYGNIGTQGASNGIWYDGVNGKVDLYLGGDRYNNTALINQTANTFVITWDSGNALFYLNGKADGGFGVAGDHTFTFNSLGADDGGFSDPLVGSVSDYRIYLNRTLTPADAQAYHQDPFRLYRPRSEWWRNAVAAPAASSIVHRRTLGQRTGSRAA